MTSFLFSDICKTATTGRYLIKIIDLKSYQRENRNFQENGDEGEVWFGEDAMNRMVKFLDKMVEEDLIQNNDPVVDLGTGNG